MALYRSKKTRPNPKILVTLTDVEGSVWDVRQIRDTKHGFDLLFGSPASHLEAYRGGLPRLIATQPLYDFWMANRTKHNGAMFDLPAGRTTLKRVRRRLGFNYWDDISDFFKERIEDLQSLSAREFAARHKVDISVVFDTRRKLLGKRARDVGWWTDPSSLQVLQSDITLREMGEKLGISTSQANRLKYRARIPMAA
jgi:hypothetical protein